MGAYSDLWGADIHSPLNMAFDAGVDQISITSTGTPGGAKSTGAGANAFGNNADISAEAWVKTSNGDGGIIGEWIKSSGQKLEDLW